MIPTDSRSRLVAFFGACSTSAAPAPFDRSTGFAAVFHILEEDVKEQVDPGVYDQQVGLLEMTLDVEQVRAAAQAFPGRDGA